MLSYGGFRELNNRKTRSITNNKVVCGIPKDTPYLDISRINYNAQMILSLSPVAKMTEDNLCKYSGAQ